MTNTVVYQEGAEVVTVGAPKTQVFQEGIEVVTVGDPKMQVFQLGIEVIYASSYVPGGFFAAV